MYSLERHESYRGRSSPEIEWRVWNVDHSSYSSFKSKREAVAYLAVCNEIEKEA